MGNQSTASAAKCRSKPKTTHLSVPCRKCTQCRHTIHTIPSIKYKEAEQIKNPVKSSLLLKVQSSALRQKGSLLPKDGIL